MLPEPLRDIPTMEAKQRQKEGMINCPQQPEGKGVDFKTTLIA